MTLYRLAELAPASLKERLRTVPALVVPLGTVEWHGNHLPLGLDLLKAEAIAEEVARTTGAVLAPGSWWAAGGVPFPCTLRLETEAVTKLLGAVLTQLAQAGFGVICVVNGHYGLDNSRATRRAALECMGATSATVLVIADYEVLLSEGAQGDHAGIWETSLLWARRPDLVHLDSAADDEPLVGVIGDDPRGVASASLGAQGVKLASARISNSIGRALAEPAEARGRYVRAIHAALEALDALAELRRRLPRAAVPPVLTPSWKRHLEALSDGLYDNAHEAAERKRDDAAA